MIRHRRKGQERPTVNENLLKRNYEDLANAIVAQACYDYKHCGTGAKARMEKEELEKFFHSKYFGILTSINPQWLLQKLDKQDIKVFKDYY